MTEVEGEGRHVIIEERLHVVVGPVEAGRGVTEECAVRGRLDGVGVSSVVEHSVGYECCRSLEDSKNHEVILETFRTISHELGRQFRGGNYGVSLSGPHLQIRGVEELGVLATGFDDGELMMPLECLRYKGEICGPYESEWVCLV